jgi:hypothetical protein
VSNSSRKAYSSALDKGQHTGCAETMVTSMSITPIGLHTRALACTHPGTDLPVSLKDVSYQKTGPRGSLFPSPLAARDPTVPLPKSRRAQHRRSQPRATCPESRLHKEHGHQPCACPSAAQYSARPKLETLPSDSLPSLYYAIVWKPGSTMPPKASLKAYRILHGPLMDAKQQA